MRRNGIVVSLDGHGADELLAGYGESLFTAYPDCRNLNDVLDIIRTYRGLFGETRQFRVRSTAGCLVDYLTHWVFQPRVTAARRFLRRSASRALGEDRLRRWSGRTSAQEVVRSPFGVESLQEAADRPWPPGFDRLDAFGRHLYLLFHETTLPTLMRNYDRYAMANGVEVRAPFLDHRLVSYCFSLPWSSKVRGGFTKRILRDAMTDMLPPEIRLRKVKIGFGAPAVEWLQGGLRTYAQDTTSSREFLECPVLEDPAYTRARIERVLTAPQAQYRDAEASWTDLLTFLWYRTFIRNGAGRVKDAARKAAVAVAG
jgi:asparagine synthase (glutamine-hydrolysing)